MISSNREVSRKLSQQKQDSFLIEKGIPSANDLIEGIPQFRKINGRVYLCAKIDNKVYYFDSHSSKEVSKIKENKGERSLLSHHTEVPERALANNIHGGIQSLASSGTVTPVPATYNVTKGIGKIYLVCDTLTAAGTLVITGTKVDRNTGVETSTSESFIVDEVTTDTSGTEGALSHAIYTMVNGYLSRYWWRGTVTFSTSDTLNAVFDTYHVSFEQFNSAPIYKLDSFDANLYSTNANVQFDAYLYSIAHTGEGQKANITIEASLHLGTLGGYSPLTSSYHRLRKGNLNKTLGCERDGVWVTIWYDSAVIYAQNVTVKVWGRIKEK